MADTLSGTPRTLDQESTPGLLGCPFCGSPDVTMYSSSGAPHGDPLAGGTRRVECNNCCASGPAEPTPRNGTAWNTRSHLEAGWQPIEQAPKMRGVLLWADTSTPDFPNWRMGSGFYHTGMDCWIWEGEQVREWAHPSTHFRPLPAPPSIPHPPAGESDRG